MQKIKSVFQRNYETDRLIRNEVVPGCEWVLVGEGVATRKYDGTCAMVKDRHLFKRYDVKKGRNVPKGFIPAQAKDETTGHWPGWLPVSADNPNDKYFVEAFLRQSYEDGTYELCGPKVQGNPERSDSHQLIRHGADKLEDCPHDFDGIRDYLKGKDIEGIVFWHPDGRMAKVKKKDYGLARGDVS